MRILFLTDNFPPEVNAPASRTFEHCREWAREGHDVTVITCAPNFPAGKIYPGYHNAWRQEEIIEQIRVVRVWSYMTRNEGFVKRSLDFLSFAVAAFVAGLFEKTDIIVATSPQFFTTWTACALGVIKRRPWIFELRDLWPESVAAVGAARAVWLLKRLESIELWLYRRCAHVVALTDAFKLNLINRGIDPNKITVITNGVDDALFYPRPKDEALCIALGVSGKFVIGYIGTHGMAHGLLMFAEASPRLPADARVMFVGDGAEKSRLVARVHELGLAGVILVDQISKADVPRYLSILDVALIPLRKSDTFLSVIPSKMFEAAGMQIPILLGVDGQSRQILEQYDAGLYFTPEDIDSFSDVVSRVMSDSALVARLKQGCARMAADYSRRALAERMLRLLEKIVALG